MPHLPLMHPIRLDDRDNGCTAEDGMMQPHLAAAQQIAGVLYVLAAFACVESREPLQTVGIIRTHRALRRNKVSNVLGHNLEQIARPCGNGALDQIRNEFEWRLQASRLEEHLSSGWATVSRNVRT